MIGNKIANRIMKVSRSSLQNTSETIRNEHDKKKILKEDVYLQKKGKFIDDLRLNDSIIMK